ncbi:MAG: lasso RiPP family leader peptide-containing protein [Candidatus Acidiferrales bacterium]
MPGKKDSAAKKPYQTPALKIHGTVRELTQKTGSTGTPDGGSFLKLYTKA